MSTSETIIEKSLARRRASVCGNSLSLESRREPFPEGEAAVENVERSTFEPCLVDEEIYNAFKVHSFPTVLNSGSVLQKKFKSLNEDKETVFSTIVGETFKEGVRPLFLSFYDNTFLDLEGRRFSTLHFNHITGQIRCEVFHLEALREHLLRVAETDSSLNLISEIMSIPYYYRDKGSYFDFNVFTEFPKTNARGFDLMQKVLTSLGADAFRL